MTDSEQVRYFVIGAPKCASTSLYDLFSNDPDYAVTEIKETNHFSAEDVDNGHYDDATVVREREDYDAQFTTPGIRIDVCPSYMSSPSALRRIKDYNREARVLILIRDPIKRAVSHYKMDVTLGFCKPDTFETIWESKAGTHYHEYFGIGKYSEWISLWQDAFGSDQVFIANLTEHPLKDSQRVMEAFLERPFSADRLPVSNVANTYNLPIPILRKLGVIRLVNRYMPTSIKDVIKQVVPRKAPMTVEIPPWMQEQLDTFYADEFALLKAMQSTA